MDESICDPGSKPRRSFIGTILKLFFIAILLLPVGAVAVWMGLSSAPSYWRIVDFSDPQTPKRVATFEQKIDKAFEQDHPADEVWELDLQQEEMRDWVAVRMPTWLAERGVVQSLPPWLSQPMIVFEEGKLILAGQVRYGDISQIVSLELKPSTGAGGELEFRMDGIRGGRIPLPRGELLNKLVSKYGSVEAAEYAALSEAQSALSKIKLPAIDVGNGRKVKIVGIDLKSGSVILKCVTIHAPKERAARMGERPLGPFSM